MPKTPDSVTAASGPAVDRSPEGLVIVDKPAGWTSHDVVAKVRRLAGTRRVGHAGTLDPMATGVLVCGVGRATRLLGYVSGFDKRYDATIRLGQSTVTDDAEGDLTGGESTASVTEDAVRTTLQTMIGQIEQVPSAVSAVKVDGKRAYARVRSGEEVQLKARPVTISSLEVGGIRRPRATLMDVDFSVTCSTGTYVRAIARDLGETLDVGGHLTMLRRTRVGAFGVSEAHTLDELETDWRIVSLSDAVRATFPVRVASTTESEDVRHGRPIELGDEDTVVAVFDDTGQALALMEPRNGSLRVVVGFAGAS
jgi:tRNA pseudouridine55 synthase